MTDLRRRGTVSTQAPATDHVTHGVREKISMYSATGFAYTAAIGCECGHNTVVARSGTRQRAQRLAELEYEDHLLKNNVVGGKPYVIGEYIAGEWAP